MRDLSIKGRILLSKTEGLCRLVYPARALDILRFFIREIDYTSFNIIWRNKPHYLKRQILGSPCDLGGLNALDFHSSNMIFKVNWINWT